MLNSVSRFIAEKIQPGHLPSAMWLTYQGIQWSQEEDGNG
jgi:hypothetical protein